MTSQVTVNAPPLRDTLTTDAVAGVVPFPVKLNPFMVVPLVGELETSFVPPPPHPARIETAMVNMSGIFGEVFVIRSLRSIAYLTFRKSNHS